MTRSVAARAADAAIVAPSPVHAVVSGLALEDVIARAADQLVVPGAADEGVVRGAARDRILARAAVDIGWQSYVTVELVVSAVAELHEYSYSLAAQSAR
jgi:hypothetical protein